MFHYCIPNDSIRSHFLQARNPVTFWILSPNSASCCLAGFRSPSPPWRVWAQLLLLTVVVLQLELVQCDFPTSLFNTRIIKVPAPCVLSQPSLLLSSSTNLKNNSVLSTIINKLRHLFTRDTSPPQPPNPPSLSPTPCQNTNFILNQKSTKWVSKFQLSSGRRSSRRSAHVSLMTLPSNKYHFFPANIASSSTRVQEDPRRQAWPR